MEEHDAMYEMMERMEGCFFGKYRGLVTDNQDPTGCGQLKVIVPAVMGEEEIWARPCVPYAGNNMGLYAIPEPKTGVWVEFEAGDPSYPIWVGCFWADGQAPKNERGTEASPPLKIIRSHQVEGQVTVKGTQKVVVEAPQIELVESATHPVVFGDKLLQYLNKLVALYQTHTHNPPAVPTPAPPLPPATPDLISFRVKTG